MTITIKRKHTNGTVYDSIRDCALSRAIKEQWKELNIVNVFEGYVVGIFEKESRQFHFDASDSGYNRKTFSDLAAGRIAEIKLSIN